MEKKFIFVLFFVLIIFFQSCEKNEDSFDYNIDKTEDYIGFGNEETYDTVIINTQGGPLLSLEIEKFYDIFREIARNHQNTYFINVHQYQTKNTLRFLLTPISFEQAKKFNEETIDMLHKTILEFKEKNKKIILVGISYGAFITQAYIEKYGVDDFENIIIMVGRLNFEEEFWQAFSRGEYLNYKNGTEIVNYSNDGWKDIGSFLMSIFAEKNIAKLAAGVGYKNYKETLKNVDLSKVIYAFGTLDQQVGRLRDDEIEFLRNKNVTIVKVENGTHKKTGYASFPIIFNNIIFKNKFFNESKFKTNSREFTLLEE